MIPILKRIVITIPLIFGVATLAFLLIHLIPGDPVDIILGDQATTVDKVALRHDLHLDEPLSTQYAGYLFRLAHGDLGRSALNHQRIVKELKARLPGTIELTFGAMLFAILIGIPLGLISAVTHRNWLRTSLHFLGLIGFSAPSFWIAPMLVWFFAIHFNWLPVSERGGFNHLVLPAVSLGLALACILLHTTKTAVSSVLHEDYIRVARAKGVSNFQLYTRHALKNAAIPIVTTLGLQFGALLSGTVITETIFDWPGVGLFLFQGIQQRNYLVVQACVLLIAIIYVVVNLITDLVYTLVDPRVRLS